MKIFNTGKPGKRASLNLSINAIVIVVLAMTLLGLGLGFIKSQIGEISGTTTEVQEQVREQIIGQLSTTGEKIYFPREQIFSKGERETIALGVQNTGGKTLYFKINVSFDEGNSDEGYDKFDLRWQKECKALSPAEAQTYGININAPNIPGTYALEAKVIGYNGSDCGEIESIYASKLSFITVG
ncbi:hypothetical protein GF361_03070 [Candidatus Woesearchaeota archaeon]|nr:hypothetical protein [Candidatus Woesearchaeota archaeon]